MREIDNKKEFSSWIHDDNKTPVAVQSINISEFYELIVDKESFEDCLFFGCEIDDKTSGNIVSKGGFVIPKSNHSKFEIHRSKLYEVDELFKGFEINDPKKGYEESYDFKIYKEYLEKGKDKPKDIRTSLYRRLHDHSITDALNELIDGKKIVAVMGGHGMERADPFYLKVAKLSRKLTQEGFLMVTGGGPGAMEATHLGAYFTCKPEEELIEAVNKIKVRPPNSPIGKEYKDSDWLDRAWKIRDEYKLTPEELSKSMSIGIPTWLYGHEPPAPFPTHIAKYFANSVREEGLLAIAKHGVIFAPGSAGTTQEIFQDATQNHYGSMDYVSPMILFGIKRWTIERPLWDFLKKTSKGKMYGELLALTDDEEEIIRRILSYNPEIYKVKK